MTKKSNFSNLAEVEEENNQTSEKEEVENNKNPDQEESDLSKNKKVQIQIYVDKALQEKLQRAFYLFNLKNIAEGKPECKKSDFMTILLERNLDAYSKQ